jgi:hypothetical protein
MQVTFGLAGTGNLFPPGSIVAPYGVATSKTVIAVSSWREPRAGRHMVTLFDACTRARLRALGRLCGSGEGQLCRPWGVRISADGAHVVVADSGNGRLTRFRVSTGAFAGHVGTGLPFVVDLEQCPGGWLAACPSDHTVHSLPSSGREGRTVLGRKGDSDGVFNYPVALATIPGRGIAVREGNGGRFQVFSRVEGVPGAPAPLAAPGAGAGAAGRAPAVAPPPVPGPRLGPGPSAVSQPGARANL